MTDLPGDLPGDLAGDLAGGLDEPEELQPAEGSLRLVGDDDRYDAAAWEAASAAVLRKARRLGEDAPDSDVWTALTRTTLDGIAVPPIGQPADLDALTTSGRPTRAGAWDVRTQVEVVDDKAANEAALQDLENGGTSLLLHLDTERDHDWATVLEGVLLDLAPVVLDRPTTEQVEAFADFLEGVEGALHPATNLSFDLQTLEMLHHRVRDDRVEARDLFAPLARRAIQLGVRGLVVDGTALHDQGASDAQELGWMVATGVAYLRLLADEGLSVEHAARLIEFRLAATDEQFPTIAKMRAARRLWARVLEASGGAGEMALHAVTSRPMTSGRDPWVNMLRGTVAAFAAGVGGADALTVVPFDEPLGAPDAFGRRIARNTSSLLIEESHVAAVTDPAGGSYAVERLTDDLAAAGWAELGRIESAGGALADEARAGVKERVRAVRAERDAQVADRSRPLTGVSEFPHLDEVLPEREHLPHRYVHHYGRAFEDMRAEPAATPVFLATMGPVAAHTARATFATNLLAAGGVAVEAAGPTDGVDAVVAAYSGQRVVCLAGTDAAYAEWGADLVAALRAAGASYVVLAGTPGERTVTDVDDSCAMGVDALGFLAHIREELAR
ncbi:methylmalonyl-CoA mutase family protein [Nocardioides sp. zg-1228]|uniref:methylmalonyl-CoA mutase family protein n=1 Tax=Nocardioides sp. zg-1228 TaxID=2763008 RepID=UPI0016429824|nr:methylmalonyl-CoA mutase family protein [Nocardioides sp. zg-1228]MBC2933744.1 methylmalonyl-CoA mutase [Nocardioides sp. zg-1228]QSF58524.1 methylmalonyl-CoA mutase [Nocardioides sp. zg-1228]